MQAGTATAIERAAKIYWMLRESTDDDAEFERLLKQILEAARRIEEERRRKEEASPDVAVEEA